MSKIFIRPCPWGEDLHLICLVVYNVIYNADILVTLKSIKYDMHSRSLYIYHDFQELKSRLTVLMLGILMD